MPENQQTLVYVGEALNWFCNIEKINKTSIECRTPSINKKYSPGTPVSVVVSTRLLILNSCSGKCSFTYNSASASPSLTTSSTLKTNVGTVTLNGTLLVDSNNFAEVTLTNSVTGEIVVLPATNTSNTSVTFNVTNYVFSGTYLVKVRNAIGESNGLSLIVYWNPGTVSWGAGGSNAGNIITLSSGAGYPKEIDNKIFSVSLKSPGMVYPLNIVSCCGSNTISMEMPASPSGTAFTLTFTGPTNVVTKTYSTSTYYTPTANITSLSSSLNTSVGAKNISFIATNSYITTILSIKLVSTLNKDHAINIPNSTWNTNGTGANATTTFTAVLNAGSYRLVVNSAPYGYI